MQSILRRIVDGLLDHFILGELRDLEKQLNEGGLSTHELEKAKKRLEQEKEELAQSLEVDTIIYT